MAALLRALPLVALLLTVAYDATAQRWARQSAPTVVEYPEGQWAITICGTHPVTWYSEEMPESERARVEAHEAAHRRFMASFLSCWDYRSWVRESASHPVQEEAIAYCAGARHDVESGRHRSLGEAIDDHSERLGLQLSLRPAAAAAAIRLVCGSG